MPIIPDAVEIKTTYENFIVQCPKCKDRNIFNRATDLKDNKPIANKEVMCLNTSCAKPFIINNDSINAAYEMLISDCEGLIKSKHYMYCILNLAQAYEVFFSQYLRVELLYRPYALDSNRDIEELNRLSNLLYDKVKKHAYAKMRNVFLYQALKQSTIDSLADAKSEINGLPSKPNEPSDDAIDYISDTNLSELLKRLKRSKASDLRNQVVHKLAYRPTLEDVNDTIKETKEILYPLGRMLDINKDDLNWYITKHIKK